MPADVAGRRRAEDRLGDRVAQRVGVGVTDQPALEGNRHAAENQRTPFDEAVDVVAGAGAADA